MGGVEVSLSSFIKIPGLISWRPGLFAVLCHDQRSIRVIRFSVGVTLAVALAYGINWPLSFLMPVLTSVFLAMPIPAPSISQGLNNMMQTLIAFIFGIVFNLVFMQYPLVYIPMLGLVLFNIYYYMNRGGSFWLVLMLLLAVLIVPMMGTVNQALALGFADGFVLSGLLTVLMIWLAYGLFPDLDEVKALPKRPGFQPGYSRPAALLALKSTVAVLPIAIFFISFNLTGQLLVMVNAAIFSLSPDVAKGRQAGVKSIVTTLVGGAAAWVFYYVLVVVPEFYFLVILMLLTTMLFAMLIFSDRPRANYYGSAFVALLILVNSSMDAGSDFASNFIWRVIFLTLATIYIIVALRMLEHFWPNRAG